MNRNVAMIVLTFFLSQPNLIGMHEMVGLNSKLDGASLVFEMRKPFDLLGEGLLLKNSRGDRI